MTELGRGVRDVGRGFAFLNAHPRLWGWVVAPAAITLVLLAVLIAGTWWLLRHAVTPLAAHLPSWLDGMASRGLSIFLGFALGAGGLFVFFGLSGVIAGPFCERLSEAVEVELTGHEGPPSSFGRFVLDLAIGIAHALRRLLASVFGAILVFSLSFVPVVGTIAAMVLGGWFAARAAAYDSYDAVLARRRMAYRDKWAFLDMYRGRSFGLGVTVAGLLLVPGVNLIALGVGAVGATLAAHDLDAAAHHR